MNHQNPKTSRLARFWKSWRLLALCAIVCLPLFGILPLKNVAYRIASTLIPSVREGLSDELKRSVHVKGNLNTIKQLVARGADVNHAHIFGPPLESAIQGQRPDLAIFLVQNGANPNFRASATEATLFYKAATELNSPQLVHVMLQNGADIEKAAGVDDSHVLLEALQQRRHEAARSIAENVANPNARANRNRGVNDRTALMSAAHKDDIPTMRVLLKRGADINAQVTTRQNEGNTALMFAAHQQNAYALEILLRHGANPNLVPKKRYDDLSMSALLQVTVNYYGQPQKLSKNQRRMVRALLKHGADVNVGNEYSMPLGSVASRFAPDIVQEFLRRGAKVNWQNKSGWSALMSAAVVGDLPSVKLLLQAGANKKLRDEDGKTALDYARREKHLAVARVLE